MSFLHQYASIEKKYTLYFHSKVDAKTFYFADRLLSFFSTAFSSETFLLVNNLIKSNFVRSCFLPFTFQSCSISSNLPQLTDLFLNH